MHNSGSKTTLFFLFLLSSTLMLISFKGSTNEKTGENSSNNCWWSETHSSNLKIMRGDACGSSSSLRIYYTNTKSYSVRVAFYLEDVHGSLSKYHPWVVTVQPGKRTNHHICDSNGQYRVYVARADTQCQFPKYN